LVRRCSSRCWRSFAGVTAVLNLDTSVVFLTPVLVHAARRRFVH
jgi:Na+/H+ antiporter NhaD/arsenite permease-like protein